MSSPGTSKKPIGRPKKQSFPPVKATSYSNYRILRRKKQSDLDILDFTGFSEKWGPKALDEIFPKDPSLGQYDPPPQYLTSGALVRKWRDISDLGQSHILFKPSGPGKGKKPHRPVMATSYSYYRYITKKNMSDLDILDFTGFIEKWGSSALEEIFPKDPAHGALDPPPQFLVSGALVRRWRGMSEASQRRVVGSSVRPPKGSRAKGGDGGGMIPHAKQNVRKRGRAEGGSAATQQKKQKRQPGGRGDLDGYAVTSKERGKLQHELVMQIGQTNELITFHECQFNMLKGRKRSIIDGPDTSLNEREDQLKPILSQMERHAKMISTLNATLDHQRRKLEHANCYKGGRSDGDSPTCGEEPTTQQKETAEIEGSAKQSTINNDGSLQHTVEKEPPGQPSNAKDPSRLAVDRETLLASARSLCHDIANKEPLDKILGHFSASREDDVICIEHGSSHPSVPHLGRPFIGRKGAREYFELVRGVLSHERMKFSDYIVDVTGPAVSVRGEAAFEWRGVAKGCWEVTFACRLDFDDCGKVKSYELWGDGLGAHLASAGRVTEN